MIARSAWTAARTLLPLTLSACLLVACATRDSGTGGGNSNLPGGGTPGMTTPLGCASATVHCVDVNSGPTQEFTTIQAAVKAARAGHTVLVFDGSYAGFVISRSGTSTNRITVRAQGSSAVINRVNSVGEGIRVSDASFVTIEGFTVTHMPAFGLTARDTDPAHPMHGVIIRGNTVTNSGSTNIYLSEVADSLIEGNSASGSVASHGIYLANGGSDNTILRGNHCFNNHVNGIHLNGDEDVGPGGDGLHTGITIENNIIHGNAANGLDLDGMQDSLIRNNLIYNNGRNAVRAFAIDAAAGPKNLSIVNNTLVVPSGSGWPIKLTEDLGGHTFFNNILVSNGSNRSIAVDNLNFQSNNNMVNGGFSLDGDASIIKLSTWQASGHDANSLVATPAALFTNPVADAYTLKAGAPAANGGVASFNGVSAPAADILGVARPQGSAYDIGAYESF
jgi:parallel beta-helix repeat protein